VVVDARMRFMSIFGGWIKSVTILRFLTPQFRAKRQDPIRDYLGYLASLKLDKYN
jgi:hypothetical protein